MDVFQVLDASAGCTREGNGVAEIVEVEERGTGVCICCGAFCSWGGFGLLDRMCIWALPEKPGLDNLH